MWVCHRAGSESPEQRTWQSFPKRVTNAGKSEICLLGGAHPKSEGVFHPPRTYSEQVLLHMGQSCTRGAGTEREDVWTGTEGRLSTSSQLALLPGCAACGWYLHLSVRLCKMRVKTPLTPKGGRGFLL